MSGKVAFTREELLQIALLCRIGLVEIGVIDDPIVKRIWDKIHPVLDKEALEEIDEQVDHHLGENRDEYEHDDIDPEIHRTLEKALIDGHRLRILYYAHSKDETTERIIQPYEIIDEPNGPYLSAFCELRNADRVFRLDAIEKILEVLPPE